VREFETKYDNITETRLLLAPVQDGVPAGLSPLKITLGSALAGLVLGYFLALLLKLIENATSAGLLRSESISYSAPQTKVHTIRRSRAGDGLEKPVSGMAR